MTDRREVFVALLRGINVSGRNKIPMATLRAVCTDIGCKDVRTYIQSGNVVFASGSSAGVLEARLEQAIERELRLSIAVIVRSASRWRRYVKRNPFSDESKTDAKWVLLALSKRPPQRDAASALQQRAALGERVVKTGDAIWIHYAGGVARSKLTPAVLDRHVGSSVTARNWRTVLKLDEMMQESTAE